MHNSSPVSSRLARKEQKKMTQQTIIFSAIAIFLFLLFIFVIVPGVIRLAGSIVGTNLGNSPEDTIPPVAPIISSPVSATNSAQINISGFAEKGSEAVLVLNSEEFSREKVSDEGSFEFEVPLQDGENTLAFYAVDEAGNESGTTKTYRVVADQEAPELVIESPQDGTEIISRTNQQLQIKGTAGEKAKVYVNDKLLFTKSDGSFSGSFQLQEGENKLLFKATDEAGNTTEKEITVRFRL
ncbi:MAG TPA: hypothetical protein VF209_02795 [Patescibacteria group bacterium]